MSICPRCLKNKERLGALSRFGNYYVCDQCGNEEALEVMLKRNLISKVQYNEAVVGINTIYNTVV